MSLDTCQPGLVEKKRVVPFDKLHPIVYAICLSVFVFIIAMLFFSPTTKADDYDMENILYGGVTSQYSGFVLYIHPILGMVMKSLLSICPVLPWYMIVQYLFMILAFAGVAYVLLQKFEKRQALLYWFILMCFSSYEFYVRITFTKTSGVLIAIGLFLTLFAIDNERSYRMYVFGLLMVCVGILYRISMLKLVLCIFFSAFLCFLFFTIKSGNSAKLRCGVSKFLLITFALVLFSEGANRIKVEMFSQNESWSYYLDYNSARAALFDYGWPDYDEYRNEYQKLGVSENDFKVWNQYSNTADPDKFSKEKMKEIREIYSFSKDESIGKIIKDATKNLIKYFSKVKMFWCFILLSILFGVSKRKYKFATWSLIFSFYLFAYYYMFYMGRLRYHVDVIVGLAVCMIILYFSGNVDSDKLSTKLHLSLVGLVMLCFVKYFYEDITSSSYYGSGSNYVKSEEIGYNQERLKLLSDDKEHFYLLGAYETNKLYPAFQPYSVIEKGFYHNIFLLNEYVFANYREALEDYGIKNPFKEITNSDTIYFCASDVTNDQMNDNLLYIQENYNPDAKITLVKNIEGMYIYRVTEGNVQLKSESKLQNINELKYEVNFMENKGQIDITGYAFVDGFDSYEQNIYIETENKDTGEVFFNLTLQEENSKYSNQDKYNGKYSSFFASIPVEQFDNNVYLIVDNAAGRYRLPIEIP